MYPRESRSFLLVELFNFALRIMGDYRERTKRYREGAQDIASLKNK